MSSRVEKLEEEIERLKQLNKILLAEKRDDELSVAYPFYSIFTAQEKEFFRVLASRGEGRLVTNEHLMHMMEGENPGMHIRVILGRLRWKMRHTSGHPWFILSVHSEGVKLVRQEHLAYTNRSGPGLRGAVRVAKGYMPPRKKFQNEHS